MFRVALTVSTTAREQFIDVTEDVADALRDGGIRDGMVTLFVPHTTAAVTANENADPDVQRDLLSWLRRLVPRGPHFVHAEDNSDAHLKASLMGPSLQVPLVDGRLRLGTWQGIYFCEFDGPRDRTLEIYVGE